MGLFGKPQLDVWQVLIYKNGYTLNHGLFISAELAKKYCEAQYRKWGSPGVILWKNNGQDTWEGGDIVDAKNKLRVFTLLKSDVTVLDERWDDITTEIMHFRLLKRISKIFAKAYKTKD